ncbi:MAG: hypothetical protein CSB44_10660 [Gammaproteobacteria bacterium]|nr:MAG: hypothetical protein CSB44_10660 [Gammaproteobacteria bacterium]
MPGPEEPGPETNGLLASYDNYLTSVMPAVRGEHFNPFITSVLDALLLWDKRQISADMLWESGLDSPSMDDRVSTRSCDSGDVTRTVAYYSKPDPDDPTKAPLASMMLDFNACILGSRTLEGKASLFVQGSSLMQRGGQGRSEQIIFDAMSMTTGDGARSLSGKYRRNAGWSGSLSDIFVLHETENYSGPEFWSPISQSSHQATYTYSPPDEVGPEPTMSKNEVTEAADANLAAGAVSVAITNLIFDLSEQTLTDGLVSMDSGSVDEASKRPYGKMVLNGALSEKGFNMTRNVSDYTSGRQFEDKVLWENALTCADIDDGVFTDLSVCRFDWY